VNDWYRRYYTWVLRRVASGQEVTDTDAWTTASLAREGLLVAVSGTTVGNMKYKISEQGNAFLKQFDPNNLIGPDDGQPAV
jgi:hypothetical protein